MKKIKTILICLFFISILIATSIYLYNENITVTTYNLEDGRKLPIIMYHHISNKNHRQNKYTISEDEFEKDLIYLKKNNFTSITINELLLHIYDDAPLPQKPIILTFDDGHESFYSYVYPLLKKYQMKAVVSVVGIFTDTYTKNEDHNLDYSYLTWKQLNEMNNSGYVEVQNHSYDLHKEEKGRKGVAKKRGESLEEYKKFLQKDILKLQEEIFMYTAHEATAFTYPFGFFSKETKQILKDMGFSAILTCAEKINIIKYDNDEWIYSLGRFNRPHGIDSDSFFNKIFKNTGLI